jgi:NAD(P)-dependent dehydrogenase (short-subunit alcohol dehydrogenase family)
LNLELSGKHALITGASKGIGYACAQAFAAEGCNVTLAARNMESLQIAQKNLELAYPGIRVQIHSVDLSNATEQSHLAELAGDYDILVNNAGSNPSGKLTDTTEAGWRQSFDLKMFGYVNLTRAACEAMQRKKRGVIVNVIGFAGERLMSQYIIGTTANAALIAFTRSVGSQSTDFGVRVVGVNPSLTATERGEKLLKLWGDKDPDNKLTNEQVLATMNLPFGRMATSEEVADAVVFLASARASYISGVVLNVDGGAAFRQ